MFPKRAIIFILLSFLVLLGFLFFGNKFLSFVVTDSVTDKYKFATSEPLEIVKRVREIIKENQNIVFSESRKGSLWWISEDGWSILDNSAVVIEFEIFSEQDCYPDEIYTCAKDPTAKLLNKIIPEIFKRNGFIIDNLNSSTSKEDETFYDYIIALRKEATKCTLITSGDRYSSNNPDNEGLPIHYTVACANQFEKSYKEQIPYLKAINKKDAVVDIEKENEDFVKLGVHFRRTGYEVIMKEEGGTWKIIYEAQEYPPCVLMIENNVPKEIYEDCQ